MNPTDKDMKLAGLRVLLAEDEMTVALSLQMLLEGADCHVVKTAGVTKALALAQTEPFDGALLDVNLGGDKVYPAAEALAARGIPLIFVTGYSVNQIEAQWRARPALAKPFAPEDLESLMAETFAPTQRDQPAGVPSEDQG